MINEFYINRPVRFSGTDLIPGGQGNLPLFPQAELKKLFAVKRVWAKLTLVRLKMPSNLLKRWAKF